ELSTIRWALQISLDAAADKQHEEYADEGDGGAEGDDTDTPEYYGSADDLWELALIDKDAEANLKSTEQAVGPGWEESGTLNQLISYYRAKKDHKHIIELIERVCDSEKLLRLRLLREYLKACYEARDYARVEKILEGAQKLSASLGNDVLLNRL